MGRVSAAWSIIDVRIRLAKEEPMRKPLNLGLAIEPRGDDIGTWVRLAKVAERLGYSSLWTGEAYGLDAVTPLAWLAAHTTTIAVGTSIMQIPARSPAMTAMTAVTMAELTGGRFRLGLGLSGPTVAEGWHGQPSDQPLGRTREYLDIVGQIIAAKASVSLDGASYQVPYTGPGATGPGARLRPLAKTAHSIPIYLAALGPKNVGLAVEATDGLLPVMWSPTNWSKVYGDDLFDSAREGFDIAPRVWVSLGEDLAACRDKVREHIAFYLGAMGPIGKNFYAELVRQYGYEDVVIQVAECYAEGRRGEASAFVTDELVDEVGLVGPRSHVAEQLEGWRDGPARTLIVDVTTETDLELLAELAL
jgi:F420-dependent oxidoreductase-like protein